MLQHIFYCVNYVNTTSNSPHIFLHTHLRVHGYNILISIQCYSDNRIVVVIEGNLEEQKEKEEEENNYIFIAF